MSFSETRRTSDPAPEPGMDQRQSRRLQSVSFIWYKILRDEAEQEDPADEGISKMCDISKSGVGLYVMRPMPVDKTVFIEITTKSFNFSAVGRIRYSRASDRGYFRIGIRFIAIPPNDRLLLSELIGGDEENGQQN